MSSLRIGKLLVVGFVLAQAFRDVYLGGVFQTEHMAAVIFLVSAISVPMFGLLWFAQTRRIPRLSASSCPDLVWVNLSTAVAWLTYFFALQGIEPASANLLHEGSIPIGAFVLTLFGLAPIGRAVGSLEGRFYLGMALSLGLVSWVVLSGRSGFTRADSADSLVMIGSAITSGLAIATSFVSARRLNDAGVSATGVMAMRFLGLTLVSGGIAYYDGATINGGAISVAIASSLLILLPIYALQLAIARVSALTVGVLTSLGPVVIFALQILEARVDVSRWTLVSIVIYSILSICANLVRAREDSSS